jgi:hypothetical protein
MKDLKEQIIEAVQDSTDIVDGTVSIPILDHFLDGILSKQLRIHDVVGRSEQFKCGMQLSKSGKRCEKQCVDCELTYKNYSI